MKIADIKNLTTEEVNKKIADDKEELMNLRFQQAMGNLQKTTRLKELRREVARLKTILNEREMTNE